MEDEEWLTINATDLLQMDVVESETDMDEYVEVYQYPAPDDDPITSQEQDENEPPTARIMFHELVSEHVEQDTQQTRRRRGKRLG
jgi:hypothetical protein